jgi:ribulose 1,5-bisphosphate synthetase/thiazole synthase
MEHSSRVDSHRNDAAEAHLRQGVVENLRPLKVIVIGAGYSGIYHGVRIPERIKNCELTIYEKNDAVGGTW